MGLVSLLRLAIAESVAYRSWKLGRRFPGISIHHSAAVDVRGAFIYGRESGIDRQATVTVPPQARLVIGERCRIGRGVELGPSGSIAIGDRTSIQDRCTILGEVRIGRYCVFAPEVFVSSGAHHWSEQPAALIQDQDMAAAARAPVDLRPVVIEDDCWIGVHAVIMPGVVVGKGSIVGANAVVTRNVAPYTVVAGVPARELRRRLAFAPPRALDHRDPAQRPYFYRGFLVADDERAAAADGLRARSEFAAALSSPDPPRAVTLTARSLAGSAIRVVHGSTALALGPQLAELSFPPAPGGDGLFVFRVEPPAAAPALVVSGLALT